MDYKKAITAIAKQKGLEIPALLDAAKISPDRQREIMEKGKDINQREVAGIAEAADIMPPIVHLMAIENSDASDEKKEMCAILLPHVQNLALALCDSKPGDTVE